MNEDSEQPEPLTQEDLAKGIPNSAFAFRGYNVTNLGRTPELLRHPTYGPIVEQHLREASEICADAMQMPIDLVQRVREEKEATLKEYHEAISLIVAVELAQIEILKKIFDIRLANANMMYGFSLGELTALSAGGVLTMADALRIPLLMSKDAADLANDATLCVLFSRSDKLIPRRNVFQLCAKINAEGKGVIGVSTFLAPNSMLLIGQADTVQRLKARTGELTSERVTVRLNDDKWPPMHTPIVWQRNITNRSQLLMHTIQGGFTEPSPPLFSLVTGDFSYDDVNMRDIVGDWTDHPQLLWEAVDTTLARGVETIIHVGPQPNIIPATFSRLAANVTLMAKDRLHMQTLSWVVHHGWLSALLPKRTNLLRAPNIAQVTLEDWLLGQEFE
ncbi:MAG: ACP S-malonyltransferase [Fuerstiella sp.]